MIGSLCIQMRPVKWRLLYRVIQLSYVLWKHQKFGLSFLIYHFPREAHSISYLNGKRLIASILGTE